ncbi:oxidoreductase NAD-binding domain-containing protein 1 [Scleropages formosus]|uniref:Oxidoreductase NAD-binding domain-containing protein 1 n=1 Tax=Scleropages formosus TaxID=113540 RepID=A0A8C9RT27_SCLFO|nr:oxidoreductase NAD-binding domain-containing protein 1 [Scleropages formosus]XP_018606041.2 oxidoreductase NAD-binding domain-containing protein 1 [Scleropages formosus]XP_018606042.2 oxidoreductase NAD-binding domain-containing protein 1 [Scleropages formosus]
MNVSGLLRAAAGSFTARGASQASSLLSSSLSPSSLLSFSLCSSCSVTRKMTSRRQADHLERTSSNYRQESIFPARVCGIMNESMTVKRLRLAVPGSDFTFKAGQWVDFFIPGVEKVGGFSICSSPGLLQREGVIELAVKYSQHAPAYWIHKECAVDSEVAVRVGGDFFFDPQPSDLPVDLLLVAGGVGINPLYSILLHMVDLLRGRRSRPDAYEPKSVRLCYSAKNPQELLFKKTIAEVCQEFPGKVSCDFHVTQDSEDVDPQLRPLIRKGRISEEVLKEHLRGRDTLCYLCGPPPMIESVSEQLLHLGLSQDSILFEKWW